MKISLIEFSVENFKIFKDKATFSMSYRKIQNENKTFESNGENLLKTSLIFGPNASGKTTVLQAIQLMKQLLMHSSDSPIKQPLPYNPYLFSDEASHPSFFEVVMSLGENIYRYNFSISAEAVVAENLFDENGVAPKPIFQRSGNEISLFGEFDTKNNRDVMSEKTREHALFLSSVAQWGDAVAQSIIEGMSKSINVIDSSNSQSYAAFTFDSFKDKPEYKSEILKLLKRADFSIVDGRVTKEDAPPAMKNIFSSINRPIPEHVYSILLAHNRFNAEKIVSGTVDMSLFDESKGTINYFTLLGPIIDTLKNGKILMIDEFDNSLHPDLTKFIIDLFELENGNNAQLVVTTHDTSLMTRKKEVIKSQIWFTSKNKFGEGKLYSMDEYKLDLRNDTEYQKKYLEGRFGALPFID